MSKRWRTVIHKQAIPTAKSQGITEDDLAFMLSEFRRLAEVDNPEADETIDFIAQTNNEWLRQKPLWQAKAVQWRNIIQPIRRVRVLRLIIILKKTDNTYDIAERLWEKLEPKNRDE
jgi:hypothetical protein